MRPLVYIAYKVMALMLALMQSLGMAGLPDGSDPVKIDPEAVATFVFWGDCQVSNYLYKREATFIKACADLDNIDGRADALLLVGDVAENGMESEYKFIAEKLNPYAGKFGAFIAAEGNHDIRLKAFKLQQKRFSSFVNSVENSVPLPEGRYYYSTEVKGYKIIVLGSEKTVFEESYLSDAQLSWLDGEIASTQGTGKPVFVMVHQPLQYTHGLPETWGSVNPLKGGSVGKQSDALRAIFEKYDNVILLSGHLHSGTGKYSYEDYGAFKSLNVQSLCVSNKQGVENDGQGYIISVYEDKIVARARIFAEGRYVDESVENAVVEIPLG